MKHPEPTPMRPLASAPTASSLLLKRRLGGLLGLGLLGLAFAHTAPAAKDARSSTYAQDTRVSAFAKDWAARHGVAAAPLVAELSRVQMRHDIVKLMTPSVQQRSKNWRIYRARFITPERVEAGRTFWEAHRPALKRAQQQFGVDAHVIAGILGVETQFGANKGSVPALEALVTLGFDFPASHPKADQRQAYFRNELSEFLLLRLEQEQASQSWQGSYAGALGYPQFMPSSWRKWAIDFDGDGRVDLLNSPIDAIGSVANYLEQHGWVAGWPARWPAEVNRKTVRNLDVLLEHDILPKLTASQLKEAGVKGVPPAVNNDTPLALVELLNGKNAPTYVIGTPNFYAITRYNQSSYYALAVIELGEAVANAVKARP